MTSIATAACTVTSISQYKLAIDLMSASSFMFTLGEAMNFSDVHGFSLYNGQIIPWYNNYYSKGWPDV